MGCIPASMELFPAMDEETFEFIKTVIDDCVYYLLIIANLYGSLAPDGISYTEKEFDYAVSKGIKVVALIHEKPETLPFDKSEETAETRARLTSFRAKVKTSRIVKFWTKPEELPGLVAINVQHAIRKDPAVGWVRADQVASTGLLTELNEVRKRNQEIRVSACRGLARPEFEGLASLDEPAPLYWQLGSGVLKSNGRSAQLRELFAWLSPRLLEPKREDEVHKLIGKWARPQLNSHPYVSLEALLDEEAFQTLKVQYIAPKLITVTSSLAGPTWSLSASGRRISSNCGPSSDLRSNALAWGFDCASPPAEAAQPRPPDEASLPKPSTE